MNFINLHPLNPRTMTSTPIITTYTLDTIHRHSPEPDSLHLKNNDTMTPYSVVPRSDLARTTDEKLVQHWLETLERPDSMTDEGYRTFMQYCTEFFVAKNRLWQKDPAGQHKIINQEKRIFLLTTAHNDVGHHGIYATNALLAEQYWWPLMMQDIAWFVKTCHICQVQKTCQVLIPPTVAMPTPLFSKVYMDTMHMLHSSGYKYIAQGQCSLVYWPEWMMLRKENAKSLGQWILQDILHRWGLLLKIVMDNGLAFLKALAYLEKYYHIKHIRISGYNYRANGLVEQSHFKVWEAIFKACD